LSITEQRAVGLIPAWSLAFLQAFSFSVIDPCPGTVRTKISFLLFISLATALSSSFVILSIMFYFLISSITILNAWSGKSLSCCKKSKIPTDSTGLVSSFG